MLNEIPINPTLPPDFDNTPNDRRPESHREWWFRPYIVTYKCPLRTQTVGGEALWKHDWPEGVRYDVRCLDGGAWDRSTCHGSFKDERTARSVARELAATLAEHRERVTPRSQPAQHAG